jgi:hypothetical protein
VARLEITYTDQYLVEAWKRFRRAKFAARATVMLKILLGAILLLLIWMLVIVQAYVAVGFVAIFLVLLVFRQPIDAFLLVRRCRRSPFRGDTFTVEIAPKGVSGKGSKSDATVDWTAYSWARQFTDGFLLVQHPANYFWLPNDCIKEGAVGDIDQILRAHISDYKRL